jgi:hypothetical protein
MPIYVRSFRVSSLFLDNESLACYIDNLNHNLMWKNLLHERDAGRLLSMGLFPQPNPSCYQEDAFLRCVVEAFKRIELGNVSIQFEVCQFYCWLRDDLIQFLKRIEEGIRDIFVRVNDYFQRERIPTLEKIMKDLRNHFSKVPLCILNSMFLWNLRKNRHLSLFLKPKSPKALFISKFMLAKLQGRNIPSTTLEQKVGLARNNSLILISKFDNLPRVEGKLLRRRLLGLSVAQNIIKRLSDSQRDMFFLLMRVLGARSFA